MTTEVRKVSETGGEKGDKLARYDLIPAGPLRELAMLYGEGARKYTKYGDCTCAAGNLSTPEGSVDPATRKSFDPEILSSQNVSARTVENGSLVPEIKSELRRRTLAAFRVLELIGRTDSPEKSTTPTSPSLVESAGPSLSTSTTTTSAALRERGAGRASGAGSATAATSDSDISKVGSRNIKTQHSPGCPALSVRETGDRNWEKGYAWHLSFAALNRHLWQFWDRESYDTETRRHHLASVIFHAMAMMEWERTHPEYDDRPGNTGLEHLSPVAQPRTNTLQQLYKGSRGDLAASDEG